MLSISPPMSGAGQGDYYLNLAREDYYLEGGEPPGQWFGSAAERLGVFGQVEKDHFRSLLMGYSSDGGRALVQNAGAADRQTGWDLTFSAPKTVSVAWSQSDGSIRKEIEIAHREAVSVALNYLDSTAGFTRRGKGGATKEHTGLVIATFEHGTSRAQDPQMHTHALVLNVAPRSDGTTGTIESKPLFANKMTAGALYRAELASQLEQRLGLVAEKKNSWFELQGVSNSLTEEFSKRRKDITDALEAKGLSSAQAAKVAALDTRGAKEHIARGELFKQWKEVGAEYGWSTEQLNQLVQSKRIERDKGREVNGALNAALTKITEQNSHFAERDLIRACAEHAQGRGVSGKDAQTASKHCLESSPEIVSLGRVKGELRYTTKEILELEGRMLGQAEQSKTRNFPAVSASTLDGVFAARGSISDEQKAAVTHLTQRPGTVQIVSGMAGTGKSYMLGAAREAWEQSSIIVYGAALSGKAAQGLQDGSGIQSETIHKTLKDIENGNLQLNGRTALVVDEAGMVGTRQMARLMEISEQTGAKLVFVGDAKQLQPIEAGGGFKALAEKLGHVELKDIRRQDESWAREAVHSVAQGDGAAALAEFAKRGMVTVKDTRKDAIRTLIKDWSGQGIDSPKENLILAGNNSEVRELNELAQEGRFGAGKLGEKNIKVGVERVYENDRVVMTRNSRLYGVRNGQLGTVDSIQERQNSVIVRLDSGGQVKLPLKEYDHLRLGYAVTTHKSQGMTAGNTFVLTGGAMQDRELSYVQVSRAKGETRLYTDKLEAGENLTSLAKSMTTSRQKELASDVGNTPQKSQPISRSV